MNIEARVMALEKQTEPAVDIYEEMRKSSKAFQERIEKAADGDGLARLINELIQLKKGVVNS